MRQTPSIAISTSISEFFSSIVEEALRARNVKASSSASQYLVGVLADYVHPKEEAEPTFGRPLLFQLYEALASSGSDRFHRLRMLGDGVLYGVGFFGSHIELRGVDRKYVVGVGITAYDSASAMLRGSTMGKAQHDVLQELAEKFDQFVEVLAEVSDGALAQGACGERGLVNLYERWLKTGSSRIAEELGARGLMPLRGKGGAN